jgi:hypothetical protein
MMVSLHLSLFVMLLVYIPPWSATICSIDHPLTRILHFSYHWLLVTTSITCSAIPPSFHLSVVLLVYIPPWSATICSIDHPLTRILHFSYHWLLVSTSITCSAILYCFHLSVMQLDHVPPQSAIVCFIDSVFILYLPLFMFSTYH